MSQRRGFTLVEVLLALVIMGVVTGALYRLLNTNQRLALAQAEQVSLQSNVRTGSLIEVAAVLKSLVALSRTKPLSFREKKMLDRARHMLVSEVSIARNVPEVTAMVLMQRALGKAGLQLPEAL